MSGTLAVAPGAAPAPPPADLWRRGAWLRRLRSLGLRLVPLAALGRVVRRPVIGLCYHVVSERPLAHVRHLYRYKTPEQFESDLRFVERHFRVLSFEEVRDGRAAAGGDGRPGVVLTFDDGLAECFSVVRPLLLEHGLPCLFFLAPGVLDNRRLFAVEKVSLLLDALLEADPEARDDVMAGSADAAGARFRDTDAFARWITTWVRSIDAEGEALLDRLCGRLGVDPEEYLRRHRPYLTTEEARTLAADGFTLGGHSLRHAALGRLESPEEVEREIVESCRAVAELAGARSVPFAFPFDADGVDRDLLAGILERNPAVGPLFDTRRLRRDREFMVNRMIVDAPPAVGRAGSNLPTYLRVAYWEELMRGAA